MRRILIIVSCFAAVLLASYAGYHGYKAWKDKHLMALSHEFLAKSDNRKALLAAQEVLRSDPDNLDATRVMAQITEASRSPSALLWRSRVVELAPHSFMDRLALAQTALAMRDFAAATNALEKVDPADKKTAAYHNVAGEAATAGNKLADAENHFLEASRIEPQNLAPQLNLAVVRLHDTNLTDLAEARSTLQRLAVNPTNSFLRCRALRELTLDALAQKSQDAGLALSRQLIQETNCSFADRILRLEALQKSRSPDFRPALAACQHEAATNQGKIFELVTWEMAKNSPDDALAWLWSLPANSKTNQPTTLLIAECCSATQDWTRLQAWLQKQNWDELEFTRHAFLSKALRGQELADSAKTEWDLALKAANGQKTSLVMLLRLAAQWNWSGEGEELLWTIFNRYPAEKWASQALTQVLYRAGQTRSLMQLFNQEVQRNPSDPEAKNNLAMTAMLLGAKEFKPYDLTRDVYKLAPTNASYASTYAYSLYVQGKGDEALKVMQQLEPQDLDIPAVAGYYGLILKATGNPTKAKAYLHLTSKAVFLPEEQELFAQAMAGT